MSRDFTRVHRFEWRNQVYKDDTKFADAQKNLRENVCNFAVGNVPADGLAPLGARTSADTKFGADTKFVFVYTG